MGLVTINSDSWQEVKFEREFYAMAQVSRAARPGSRPIETSITKDQQQRGDGSISALGFLHADGNRALFVANYSDQAETVEVDSEENFFSISLPARSLATCVWAK